MPTAGTRWRSPDELVALGFERSRVVMMNESHDGLRRSVRCRRLGQRVLPAAHLAGARYLAMEALEPHFAAQANTDRVVPRDDAGGYLGQSELRDLIQAALDLDWTLVPYEADFNHQPPELASFSMEETNRREDEQARNLADALAGLSDDTRLFVWCGNSHLSKINDSEWRPMGLRFSAHAGFEAFAIDQTQSVRFDDGNDPGILFNLAAYESELAQNGGSAGFLADEAPAEWPARGVDALVLSTDNDLT